MGVEEKKEPLSASEVKHIPEQNILMCDNYIDQVNHEESIKKSQQSVEGGRKKSTSSFRSNRSSQRHNSENKVEEGEGEYEYDEEYDEEVE